MKYLYKYVKADIIANNWYVIGVELFDAGEQVVLDTIKKSHPSDPDNCTVEMLRLWLERNPKASWNQLLGVFREPHIQLNTLATKIEGMLCKGTLFT